jgi:hypothetical protein
VAPAAADPRLATLLERVGKLREAGAARPREAAAPARAAAVTEMPAEAPITAPATRSWDATALEDGGGKPAAARGEDAPPPGARPAARPGEPAGAYTARLLEAKKRALRRDKKGDE